MKRPFQFGTSSAFDFNLTYLDYFFHSLIDRKACAEEIMISNT